MQIKLLALLFVTVVLTSSFVASVFPMANALVTRTDFSNRHSSASAGNSNVCGDHKCAPGEKTQWINKMSSLQRGGIGKISAGETYTDVLKHIQSTTGAKTMPGNVKMTEKISMGGNMTSVGNLTKGNK